MKKGHQSQKPTQPSRGAAPATTATGGSARRWILLGLALILTAGASWAFLEFVVWNKLPSDLVGYWEVVEGPREYREAVFEFQRSGKMIGRLNDNDKMRMMYAEVEVEGDKMYVTTRRPSTGEEHVTTQTIRTLSQRELIVADERGVVMKMVRMRGN